MKMLYYMMMYFACLGVGLFWATGDVVAPDSAKIVISGCCIVASFVYAIAMLEESDGGR